MIQSAKKIYQAGRQTDHHRVSSITQVNALQPFLLLQYVVYLTEIDNVATIVTLEADFSATLLDPNSEQFSTMEVEICTAVSRMDANKFHTSCFGSY